MRRAASRWLGLGFGFAPASSAAGAIASGSTVLGFEAASDGHLTQVAVHGPRLQPSRKRTPLNFGGSDWRRVKTDAIRSARRPGNRARLFNRCFPLFRNSQLLAISHAIAGVAALLKLRVGFIRRAAVVEVDAHVTGLFGICHYAIVFRVRVTARKCSLGGVESASLRAGFTLPLGHFAQAK
jgi:hypothetical protein